MEEVLDIVDSDNKVIGQATRKKVFEEGLLHRAANIFIFNSEGEVFLQKRSKNSLKYPLFWDMSAGEHVKTGESIEDAANRGVKEELGTFIPLKKILELHPMKSGMEDANPMIDNELVETYQGIFDGEIKINPEEIAEGRFLSIEDINRMIADTTNKFTSWFLEDWVALQNTT